MRISKAKRLGYSILLTLRMVFSYEARQTEVCFDYKYLIYQKGEIFMKRYFQKSIANFIPDNSKHYTKYQNVRKIYSKIKNKT